MIERAYVHVAGPAGAGKTTFVEAVLRGIDRCWLAARCVRNDSLRRSRETAAKGDPELRRYREAGATAAALFEFPGKDIGSDEFFMAHLMEDYSQGVVIEGDNPLGFVDLRVYVAPALPAGESVFVRRQRDRVKEERDKADAMERLLRQPHRLRVGSCHRAGSAGTYWHSDAGVRTKENASGIPETARAFQ